MSKQTIAIRICGRCLGVEGVDWSMGTVCRPERLEHDWQEATVSDCPFMVRTPTGRVSDKARHQADRECAAGDPAVHDLHHYGDMQRRHFSVLVDE